MGKVCKECGIVKELECFDNQKHGKFGKRARCKTCQAVYALNYRNRKPNFIKELKLNYRNTFDGFITTVLGECRRRALKSIKGFDLDEEFLKELWNKQNQLCKFTGHPLNYEKAPGIKNPYQGSLDRIDSNLGYIKENVRWVCWFINQMKMDYSEEEFKNLIKLANSKLD